MKVALVHDDFCQAGGAESLFATIASLFPKAPIYTSLVNWNKLPSSINPDRIRTSFLQKVPLYRQLYKTLLPLYPFGFETFDFSKYDLVISSTTRFAKGIITAPNTTHICYINSTPRFLWDKNQKKRYLSQSLVFILSPILSWLKRWDKAASARPDFYIANSQNVQKKVKKYYSRDSEIIYPFAQTSFYQVPKIHNWPLKEQRYYLVVSRLVKWKKIEIAIEACSELGVNLKIVGRGPDESRLKQFINTVIPARFASEARRAKAGIQKVWIPNQVEDSDYRTVRDDNNATIEFLGQVTREKLRELYQNSQALIVTQEEDFGIAAVEAQACGVPVIAYKKGGQKETVVDGKTGILFEKQDKNSLKDAILASSKVKWDISACRKNSLRFSQAIFEREFKRFILKWKKTTLI